ncbi:transposase [Alicyclobacillus fastidiosus]|uniref:Transposase n=1 Tax=Alicyclobacillus fastidiosus TaxID=392011 RepID=A0ABY6ZHV1_9BACL|nr:transposase [Alicyclobacillus fastidiosus]WAH42444.1 transposase [Alicyclobacillus fastidiosus]
MTTIIVLGVVLIPLAMSATNLVSHWMLFAYNVMAIISAIVSFSAASTTIYSVIRNHTVFMTTIHALFIDPFFLIPSAYLGVYVIYLLYTAVWRQFKQ